MGASSPPGGGPRIYITGPIAGVGEPARGGFQACNRRTIDALLGRGVDVVALPYPHPRVGGLRKLVEYTAGFLRLYGRVLGCPRGSILHITAVGAHFIWIEWPIVQLARLAGCKVIFDIRAGVAIRLYESRGRAFRAIYRHTLRSADAVMVEGEVYLPFVEQLVGRAPHYLPNHIDVDRLPARPAAREQVAGRTGQRVLTVVYVGRVVPEKGIAVVIDACQALQAAGESVRLLVAGDGEPAYLKALGVRATGLDARWLGPLPSEDVLPLFGQADFFLFPTTHHGEGQSNALTEALACGCVAVASAHGFNAEVIGPAGLTLRPGATGDHYAQAVLGIWRTPGAWQAASDAARARTRERFATGPVVTELQAAYRRLFGPGPKADAASS